MALAITSITPSKRQPSGGELVTIIGTDFDISDENELDAVEVKFGTRKATKVRTRPNPTLPDVLLTCILPRAPRIAKGDNSVSVDVVLTNLVTSGSVTEVDGFTYERPSLVTEQSYTNLIRTLIREMRNQIMENIRIATHTDFDVDVTDGESIIEVSKLPSIFLIGPELTENRFYSINKRPEPVDSGDPLKFDQIRVPKTVDVVFTLNGVSNSLLQILNMQHHVVMFFHRNKYLFVQRDPKDASKGEVRYEMDIIEGEDPKLRQSLGNSNIRFFASQFVIRGVDIDELDQLVVDKTHELTSEVSVTSDKI